MIFIKKYGIIKVELYAAIGGWKIKRYPLYYNILFYKSQIRNNNSKWYSNWLMDKDMDLGPIGHPSPGFSRILMNFITVLMNFITILTYSITILIRFITRLYYHFTTVLLSYYHFITIHSLITIFHHLTIIFLLSYYHIIFPIFFPL